MLGVFKKVNQYLIALLVISKVVFITNKDIVFTALQTFSREYQKLVMRMNVKLIEAEADYMGY